MLLLLRIRIITKIGKKKTTIMSSRRREQS